MDGFFGWFLVIVGVLAIFNAEKLPALRQMLEEKFKDSLDAAKEVSKSTKSKIEKVKTDIDNRKNTPQAEKEPEENTPEETEEALKFMGDYIKQAETHTQNDTPVEEQSAEQTENKNEQKSDSSAAEADEKPVDLNHFD